MNGFERLNKSGKMVTVKAIGKATLPPTHSWKVLNPSSTAHDLIVYEIDGERYVEISGSTFGTIEFTNVKDLTAEGGELKGSKAPLKIKKANLRGYTSVDADALPAIEVII